MPIIERQFPKWINYLLRKMQLCEYPGKYRLYQFMRKNFTGKVIEYDINGYAFVVPLEEWCFWIEKGPENYYPQDILPFANCINQLSEQTVFIDCGADIGTVSMMVKQRLNEKLRHLVRFICLEPNPNAFALLQANQNAIGRNTVVAMVAVSNVNGSCQLHFNTELGCDHEGHIELEENGETRVVTLDKLSKELQFDDCQNLILKVDVEGQEKALFEGASQIMSRVNKCIILLEIHPDVLNREEQTAEQIFAAAEEFGEFTWTVPELDNCVVDRGCGFFSQFPVKQYDVLGICER